MGDLIDVLLDIMYEYDYKEIRLWDHPVGVHKKFPTKIILPTFKAITAGTTYPIEINMADIPIASSFFGNWFQKEVIDRDLRHYPLGTMINKLIGSLVNNVLNDDCFLDGSPDRKYFAVKSDFGTFYEKDGYMTPFDWLYNDPAYRDVQTASLLLAKEWAPFFNKNLEIPRVDHCNYLIVYEQINAFADYSKIDLSKGSDNSIQDFRNLAIPEFKLKGQYTETKGNKLISKTTALTQKIAFKKTDIPYQRESRYFADNLNSLSQLASVHNVTITTKPLLTMFPGMIVWVDAGLLDPPNTVKSIAWLLGMGGFHVTTEVTHKADVKLNTLNRSTFTTVIEGIYVHSGAPKKEDKCVEKAAEAEKAAQEGTEKLEEQAATTTTAEEIGAKVNKILAGTEPEGEKKVK